MIHGPIFAMKRICGETLPMIRWLDTNLEQGVDFNWKINSSTNAWELFFYDNEEAMTAFILKFGTHDRT